MGREVTGGGKRLEQQSVDRIIHIAEGCQIDGPIPVFQKSIVGCQTRRDEGIDVQRRLGRPLGKPLKQIGRGHPSRRRSQ